MSLFQPAVREALKARVAIDGPTGSGKTYTALQWARILAGPDGSIGVIDTENRSAAFYSGSGERERFFDPPFEFGHLPWQPPYDPRKLTDTIAAAADELGSNGVVVVDSLTHFWSGEGGTLDIVDAAGRRAGGNNFAGWKEGTPAQRHLLDTIIHAPCHVIVTLRSKMEYVLEQNAKGKSVPVRVGMMPEQRAGIEYELTVVASMDLEHRLTVTKSRCDLIADATAPAGRSWEVAERFTAWLATGIGAVTDEQVRAITTRLDAISDTEERKAAKQAFVAQFRVRPDQLRSDMFDAAVEWLDGQVPPASPQPGDPASGVEPTGETERPSPVGESPTTEEQPA